MKQISEEQQVRVKELHLYGMNIQQKLPKNANNTNLIISYFESQQTCNFSVYFRYIISASCVNKQLRLFILVSGIVKLYLP